MFVLITGFGGEGSARAKNKREGKGECGHKHVLPALDGRKNGSAHELDPTGDKEGSCAAAGINVDC